MNETGKPILDAELLATVLEDDPSTPFGGPDHYGETLEEFLESIDWDDLEYHEYPTTLEQINQCLQECGIKPIKKEIEQ